MIKREFTMGLGAGLLIASVLSLIGYTSLMSNYGRSGLMFETEIAVDAVEENNVQKNDKSSMNDDNNNEEKAAANAVPEINTADAEGTLDEPDGADAAETVKTEGEAVKEQENVSFETENTQPTVQTQPTVRAQTPARTNTAAQERQQPVSQTQPDQNTAPQPDSQSQQQQPIQVQQQFDPAKSHAEIQTALFKIMRGESITETAAALFNQGLISNENNFKESSEQESLYTPEQPDTDKIENDGAYGEIVE